MFVTLGDALRLNLLSLGINPDTKEILMTQAPQSVIELAQPIVRALVFRDQNEMMNIKSAMETTLQIAYLKGRNQTLAETLSNPVVMSTIKSAVVKAAQRVDKSDRWVSADPDQVVQEIINAVTLHGVVQ